MGENLTDRISYDDGLAISVKKWRNEDPARTETFPTEHEALNRARELLEDGDHQAVAVSDWLRQCSGWCPPPTEVGILRKLESPTSNEGRAEIRGWGGPA